MRETTVWKGSSFIRSRHKSKSDPLRFPTAECCLYLTDFFTINGIDSTRPGFHGVLRKRNIYRTWGAFLGETTVEMKWTCYLDLKIYFSLSLVEKKKAKHEPQSHGHQITQGPVRSSDTVLWRLIKCKDQLKWRNAGHHSCDMMPAWHYIRFHSKDPIRWLNEMCVGWCVMTWSDSVKALVIKDSWHALRLNAWSLDQ